MSLEYLPTSLKHRRRSKLPGESAGLFVLLLFAAWVTPVSLSVAQDCPRMVEARALFSAGQDAARNALWADAVDRFEESYELCAMAPPLFNLAVALRALGRHLEARDTAARVLSAHEAELAPEQRREAELFLAAESARLSRLRLEGLDSVAHEIELDDARRDDTRQRPLILETNPGAHVLRIRRQGFRDFEWEGSLRDAERLSLSVELSPLESPSIFEEPAFWVVTGSILVVGAVIIGVVLATTSDGQLKPESMRIYSL